MPHQLRTIGRRHFLRNAAVGTCGLAILDAMPAGAATRMDPSLRTDWLNRWQKRIVSDAKNRYCDKEIGEEIGWLVSPFVNGFYYGYLATKEVRWVEMLIDWSDAWIRRGVKEPDGFLGWPKAGGASTGSVADFTTDNMLGDAMGLRPAVLMAATILKTPSLADRFAPKAHEYLRLAEQMFAKWDARGCWRNVKDAGVWVVPPFGLDPKTGRFTEGYGERKTDGFSLPDNKQNLIALWLIALYDATQKPVYRERAERWWRLMKQRMRTQEGGKYFVWNYWDPAGPWDYKPDGSTKHWVGVHPNGGYYGIDLEGIVAAHEHGLVFDKADLARLIATNRDFMWNHEVHGAKFRSIGGGKPDPRWANAPGVLWEALVPYDETLRRVFEANHDPASWGGLASTPWYLSTIQ